MWDRTIVSSGNKSDKCVYMTSPLKVRTAVPKVRAIHNRNDTRYTGVGKPALAL